MEFSSVLPRAGAAISWRSLLPEVGLGSAWWLCCTQTSVQAAENRSLIILNLLAVLQQKLRYHQVAYNFLQITCLGLYPGCHCSHSLELNFPDSCLNFTKKCFLSGWVLIFFVSIFWRLWPQTLILWFFVRINQEKSCFCIPGVIFILGSDWKGQDLFQWVMLPCRFYGLLIQSRCQAIHREPAVSVRHPKSLFTVVCFIFLKLPGIGGEA